MKFERYLTPAMSLGQFKDEIGKVYGEAQAKHRRIHVLFEVEKATRTTGVGSQNHHLNGHIQQICRETGNSFDDVKKYVKQWGMNLGISEADATTTECGYLIDCTHQLASELGVILEETSEY